VSTRWIRTTGKWTGRTLLAGLLACAVAVGFGTRSNDAAKMAGFADAVEHWQHNPDFRLVQVEYVTMGSDATRTRIAGVPAPDAVLFLRSLPGLPAHLRVNPTSLDHYANFAKGPLSAYLHLTAEQGLGDTLTSIEQLGQRPDLTDADIVNFLRGYHLHNPVVSDAGAVRSVRRLMTDLNPGRGFVVRDNVPNRLRARASLLAGQLGYPTDIAMLTPEQQIDVWNRLDDVVKREDYELWRTKQVNDWLNGVWAQVYGTMYAGAIRPALEARLACRVGVPSMALAWITLAVWRRRRRAGRQQDEAAANLNAGAAAGPVVDAWRSGRPRQAMRPAGVLRDAYARSSVNRARGSHEHVGGRSL